LTDATTGQTFMQSRFRAGPFVNFDRVVSFESSARSLYNGLTIDFDRRMSAGLWVRASYTLGKAVDTVPDATAVTPGLPADDAKFASNPADFNADRARSNGDRRHRLVVSAAYDTESLAQDTDTFASAAIRGWTVSMILTAQSGLPYS